MLYETSATVVYGTLPLELLATSDPKPRDLSRTLAHRVEVHRL